MLSGLHLLKIYYKRLQNCYYYQRWYQPSLDLWLGYRLLYNPAVGYNNCLEFFKDFDQGFECITKQQADCQTAWFLVFLWMLKRLFYFIGPLALLTTILYSLNTGKRPKHSFKFGINSYIQHFLQQVSFSILIIYPSLNRWPQVFSTILAQYFFVKLGTGLNSLSIVCKYSS